MHQRFFELFAGVEAHLQGVERATAWLSGETSDFVRFNGGRVRQPGSVEQADVTLRLIDGARHASAELPLSGDDEADRARLQGALERLRALLPHLPEDPHLMVCEAPSQSETARPGQPPTPEQIVEAVSAAGDRGLDMVGVYAGGDIHRGFASSWGHRNSFRARSFNLDWCLVHSADKAVKSNYAGDRWDGAAFEAKMSRAGEALTALARPPKRLDPGAYRAFLTPSALEKLIGMMCWGGFSVKAQRTRNTPLLGMLDGATLDPRVTISEHVAAGGAPDFQSDGYRRPDRTVLIRAGRLADPLISPRSAREYGVESNGASGGESPSSLEMAGGALPMADAMGALGTGLWISNLWYLNFSDRPAGRITGMTRFATFWIEGGEIVAPVDVMRFDETFSNALGANLEALTVEQEDLLSSSTYFQRSTESARVPGALIRDFTFTL